MLAINIHNDSLKIGPHFNLSFQRTLRIPDDGRTYPLPPGLGRFPIRRVSDYLSRVPEAWRERGGVFLSMYQREAMWLSFRCDWWRASAVQVGIGKVCAITGRHWRERLNRTPSRQNYVVCPSQPWLDGINAGKGFIRQFVAMPLGRGCTVEGQITGEERFGGIQIRLVEPVAGKFPEAPPADRGHWRMDSDTAPVMYCMEADAQMGLGAGGRMRQKIYPDPYGVDTWDEANSGRVFVHIANSEAWADITGEPFPPTPISAELYTAYGLPWFDLWDHEKGDLTPSEILAGVQSIDEIEGQQVEGLVIDGSW